MFSSRTPSNLTANRLTEALRAMRAGPSTALAAGGRPFIDLTESNPTRAGFDYPSDLLAPLGHSRGLTYAPSPLGALEARRAVASDYARRGLDVAPERIVLTTSTSEAYGLLFKLLVDPGDEVLVPRPSYPLFDHLARLDAATPRPYDLEYHGVWAIDFASVERAITDRTRAILVVSPNNPTGTFVKPDELDRLAVLCEHHEVSLIADEVFADYGLEPIGAQAAGRPVERRDILAFSLGGLSKSVGLPQVKLGWIATAGPDRLVGQALDRLELICDTYLPVSTPVQLAASELLERGALVRDQIARRVVANNRQLRELVASVPACHVLASDAGWYAVLQVPSLRSEEDLALSLLHTCAVLVHPGYFFDFPRESFLVVSLLVEEERFADGVGRVLRHVDGSAAH
ncbi:MAG: pyridoxal phosphate-dependent aminotransferase [Vicinamibacterales bacterium]